MMLPFITAPGVPEILLILFIVVLLFGAKKLPELARGSGRALRIFKAETKGLIDDDEDDVKKSPEQLEIDAAATREAEQRRAREEHNGPTAG